MTAPTCPTCGGGADEMWSVRAIVGALGTGPTPKPCRDLFHAPAPTEKQETGEWTVVEIPATDYHDDSEWLLHKDGDFYSNCGEGPRAKERSIALARDLNATKPMRERIAELEKLVAFVERRLGLSEGSLDYLSFEEWTDADMDFIRERIVGRAARKALEEK